MTAGGARVWDAYAEIEHASILLCRATVQAYRLGCGSLIPCEAGEDCDVPEFIAAQWARIHDARDLLRS